MTPPPGRLDFTFNFAADGTDAKARPATGVGHVVFIAPYSGATKWSTATSNLTARPLQLAEVFRIVPSTIRLEPLTNGGEPFLLPVVDADSLHPDALLETVPSLKELWEPLRDLDRDPSAAERLGALVAAPPPEATGELLQRVLGHRPTQSNRGDSSPGEGVSVGAAEELVRRFAERVLSDDATTQRSGALAASSDVRTKTEVELGRRLRALLRQGAFQSTSATWLATEMVVRSCPDDSLARFSAVDAAWAELVSDPMSFEALLDSGVSVVVVDHCFGAEHNELRGLVGLVRACHERRAFFVAGAAPSLAGLEDRFLENPSGTKHDVEAWQMDWSDEQRESWVELASLREQGAQFALALPRCLVRHPYGKKGDPLEKFEFEELEDRPESVQFLWANGAYLVARALMEQWCGQSPQMDGSYEIGGLPVVSVPDVHGRRIQPPLEFSLPRSAVDQLLDQGFSVVEARSDSDRARVYV